MELFGAANRKIYIPRIAVNDIVAAVFLMGARAKKSGCQIIFFPEAGGLPLKHVYEKFTVKQNGKQIKIFSSKITALSKSCLSKQICGILTLNERRQYLTSGQIAAFKKAATKLPLHLKKELNKMIKLSSLKRYKLSEIIPLISEIGLYIPSEGENKLLKSGIVSEKKNLDSYAPERQSFKEFQRFRKKNIIYTIDSFSGIVHEIRSLLNIVLANTNFARTIAGNKIYVVDEAISRGRTLNTLEIVFKAFDNNIKWQIGVLYCPANVAGSGNIDFILSHEQIPPFSNRFDLIGNIIVESKMAFTSYNIEKLYLKRKQGFIPNRIKVRRYLKSLRLYLKDNFFDFLAKEIFEIDDLIRLWHFIFVSGDLRMVKRCLDLNPSTGQGLIEEASFYLNMPNPFDPMPIRRAYKDYALNFLDYLPNLAVKDWKKYKKNFLAIKKDYEFLELQSWVLRRRNYFREINHFINKTKQSHE